MPSTNLNVPLTHLIIKFRFNQTIFDLSKINNLLMFMQIVFLLHH